MQRYSLSTRKFWAILLVLSLAVLAAGCGSGDGDSSEVTVQTGSLSKAEFVARADSICKAARTELLAKYTGMVATHKSAVGNKESESALLDQIVESVVSPNYTRQIEQISELGAPQGYAPEVASYLNTLQKRLDEVLEEPKEITANPFPFDKPAKAARKIGLKVCAESFG